MKPGYYASLRDGMERWGDTPPAKTDKAWVFWGSPKLYYFDGQTLEPINPETEK